MAKVKTIKLYYRYKGNPWSEFDRTRDPKWADIQLERMKKEYPGAEYKRDPENKDK